ncbi:MAG: glycine cleavage system aminomethyltransferase GcvT [Opitutales bacterium]|nr:glycine cleavage system aminomethyltransferase GcvT [Opitutales bacterium]
MSEIKNIPLRAFHEEKSARFVPFAGWNMPVQYTSIIQEHIAVRERVGLFDVSHMGEVILTGSESVAFLNYLLTNDFFDLEVGASRYSMMCEPNGMVVDDLIVYRLDEEEFLICVNASNAEKDFAWMVQHSEGFDVNLEDQSRDWVLLAIQGPQSESFLNPIAAMDLSALERFHHQKAILAEVELWFSRTGYTGEDGFELFIPSEKAEVVATAIAERAEQQGLNDFYCGLGCRDSLRLEAGYPLYGHEISDVIDPITAGLGWTVKLGKSSDFLGKSALQKIKDEKPSRRVKFYKLNDRRIARQGESIWSGEDEIGEVLSGTHSPILQCAIGSAIVDSGRLGDPSMEVRLRGKSIGLTWVKPPVHLSK